MPIKYQKWIERSDLQNNPEDVYIYLAFLFNVTRYVASVDQTVATQMKATFALAHAAKNALER